MAADVNGYDVVKGDTVIDLAIDQRRVVVSVDDRDRVLLNSGAITASRRVLVVKPADVKPRHDLDRSVAFTLLLEDAEFAASPDDGGRMVTEFLEDWYREPGTDMAAFARRWLA